MLTNEELLTRDQVADLLKVSRRTLERWEADGTLPARRIGRLVRYSKADIDAFVSAA